MRAARPERAALLLAIAIAAAIFTISFGFVADADRGTSTAAAPRAPGRQPASAHAATEPARGERVTLAAAPGLRVRASLLARPIRRARPRRVTPAPAPATTVPSVPSTEVPVQPVDAAEPVTPAPASTTPSPAPVQTPAPTPVAPKPRPKPAAKPKPPKPPDFDDSGPPTPVKRRPGSR